MSKDYDFKCKIVETRWDWTGNDAEYIYSAYVTVYDDNIELRKSGLFISSDLGTTNFYYNDISSITYDKAGFFTTSNINIVLYSGEKFVLQSVNEYDYKKIYDKWITFKNNPQKENNSGSDDSLLKYAELYKEGLITENEFSKLKQEFFGNLSDNSKDFCRNCGAELANDSKFCSECGTKVK